MKTPIEVLGLYPEHDGTLQGVLASRARQDPQRPFLLFQDATWSWGRFESAVEQAARTLAGWGLGKGAKLAVMAPNSDAYVVLFFALARIGAILVPVNPELGVTEAGYILQHAYEATPDRFVRGVPTPAALPTAVWINKPRVQEDSSEPFDTKFCPEVSHSC